MPQIRAIVLDAMGVMYNAGDDVAELLIPYVASRGGADAGRVQEFYLRASRGELCAAEFWSAVGLSERDEDVYLTRHEIAPDLIDFLEWAMAERYALACLSNDLSEWSRKLRHRFGLDRFISEWVISGDVKVRKPEPGIYEALFRRLEQDPRSMLFVDDRVKNLDAAATVGMRTALLSSVPVESRHRRVASLADLMREIANEAAWPRW